MNRSVVALATLVGSQLASSSSAAAQAAGEPGWVVPRTPSGHPDFQGNWTNATLTPFQRREGLGAVLTPEEVSRIEAGRRLECARTRSPSTPPDLH